MVLRSSAGYVIVDTSDPEEFVKAYDDAVSEGEQVYWDDPELVNMDTVREQAANQQADRIEQRRLAQELADGV